MPAWCADCETKQSDYRVKVCAYCGSSEIARRRPSAYLWCQDCNTPWHLGGERDDNGEPMCECGSSGLDVTLRHRIEIRISVR